jgi:hypothetical protein
MAFPTDKVSTQADLIGEWRFKTWTIGGIIGMSVLNAAFLPFVAAFGLGLIPLLFLWIAWFFRIGTRRYRCIRVYPDRVENISVFFQVIEKRIEASKIEVVDSAQSLLGREKYGNVVITGSGGTRMFIECIANPVTLVTALRDISSAPKSKAAVASNPADFKVCPFCSEDVKATAVKCKHCGSALK